MTYNDYQKNTGIVYCSACNVYTYMYMYMCMYIIKSMNHNSLSCEQLYANRPICMKTKSTIVHDMF